MPWWLWVLLAWSLVATLLGVAIGRAIRTAEQREGRHGTETGGRTATRGPAPQLLTDVVPLPRGQSVDPKTSTHPPEASSSGRPPQVS